MPRAPRFATTRRRGTAMHPSCSCNLPLLLEPETAVVEVRTRLIFFDRRQTRGVGAGEGRLAARNPTPPPGEAQPQAAGVRLQEPSRYRPHAASPSPVPRGLTAANLPPCSIPTMRQAEFGPTPSIAARPTCGCWIGAVWWRSSSAPSRAAGRCRYSLLAATRPGWLLPFRCYTVTTLGVFRHGECGPPIISSLHSDAAHTRSARGTCTPQTNLHTTLQKIPVGHHNARNGDTWIEYEFGLSAVKLNPDIIAAIGNHCADDNCIGHCLVTCIIHRPLALAHTSHGIWKNAQLSRMKLAVYPVHSRRGNEVV